MKRITLLSLIAHFLLLTPVFAKKETFKYPAFTIPAELKKNANAVVRLDEAEFTVHSRKSSSLTQKMVITILNKKGEAYASIPFGYSKFETLESLKITIYNSLGLVIKKVKESEIKDYSYSSAGELIGDSRFKIYEPVQKQYPYTIEYESVSDYKGLFVYPSWKAYPGYLVGVEKSIMKVIIPSEEKLRYKCINFKDSISTTTINDQNIYQWGIDSLPALKSEAYSTGVLSQSPQIILAPLDFEMDNYPGSLESWNSLGKWSAILNQGRDQIPEEEQAHIIELTKDCQTDIEKVKILYEYMQSKTRYVGIQLGIGGWQSFPAEMVSEKGYGDCKALSNYMKSLLKVVHISSNYTLVKAGESNNLQHTDFVHSYFNHVILRVPLQKDTIWLECTSQKMPFGYLGTFTDDRDVLCVNDDGGELCHTPIYTIEQNQQIQNGTFTLLKNGDAHAEISTIFTGIQYENIETLYHRSSVDDQKKFLYEEHINLPDFTINDYHFQEDKKQIPSSVLSVTLDVRNYASQTGDRLFIPLNKINRITYIPPKLENRLTDIRYIRSTEDKDSICFILPEGYKIESLPEGKIIESDFGYYQSNAELVGNKVYYTRIFRKNKNTFNASRYEEFRSFRKELAKADKASLVLKKITKS
ncbi:DUF3857 domain-containing protein [Labilibaculum euxinus]|uniref:DUF3857 domain-containing protein n=1 Tax=Labilibaculum euxinus TaxID=2686357 RepID=A0A7M4D8T6_9BACT|nr:DUF3857 domain-containing protein [Labilibaculum euxinus]MUP39065.1 DUF3857 domain-containing protein [Labilibaculum euxinus]MVB08270.1 DUF3857 domain-containing protein [Labilibaculum euxinus]